jgi:sarcosine oxidase, subunit gamma
MQTLRITDMSALARYGVKGPQASKWLAGHGVAIPKDTNSWVQSDQTLVMRLGGSEFLIEDQIIENQEDGQTCKKLIADTKRVAGVYKVPHVDAAYLLAGSEVLSLLSELCALDLRESALAENVLVMTQVAGISATVLRQNMNGEKVYRLWCDGTYGEYMRHVLDEIADELRGSA